MPDFLEGMAVASAERAARARQRTSESELRARCADLGPVRPLRLDSAGFDLLAEFKRRSPSAGALEATIDEDRAARCATAYARAGVVAISVLTEPESFHGSLADLQNAARAVTVPVMRKDFLVDPYQVLEARAHGASGVLLILRLLDDARLTEMLEACVATGQFVLLEAFDAADLARAGGQLVGAAGRDTTVLIGLNSRDLRTLQVERDRFRSLAESFPPGTLRVAESGIADVEDARRVARLGYRAALIGSSLMRADDPRGLAEAMIRAGRDEVSRCG